MPSFRNLLYFFKDGLFRNCSISCALLSASTLLQLWPTSWLSKHLQLLEVYFLPALTAGLHDASCLWRTAIPQILRLVGLLGGYLRMCFYRASQTALQSLLLVYGNYQCFILPSLTFPHKCLTIKLHLKLSLRSKSVAKRIPFQWQN